MIAFQQINFKINTKNKNAKNKKKLIILQKFLNYNNNSNNSSRSSKSNYIIMKQIIFKKIIFKFKNKILKLRMKKYKKYKII